MNLNEISTLLDCMDRRSEVLTILIDSPEDNGYLRKYWVNVWASTDWGLFTIRKQNYVAAKAKIDQARGVKESSERD